MEQYEMQTIALQQIDLVATFIRNYDSIINSLRPSIKSKTIRLYGCGRLTLIHEGLELLLKIADSNRISEVPQYTIYNILLFARLMLRHYENPRFYKPVADTIDSIREKWQKLQEKSVIQEKLVRQK